MVGNPFDQANFSFDLSSAFLSIKTDIELASFLNVNLGKLNYLLYKVEAKYIQFEIPKKSSGIRKIQAPILPLREIQYRIKEALDAIYKPTRSTHGYVKTRSIITNASKHLKKPHILNIDLKDFFPSINFGRVYGLFLARPFQFPAKVAMLLAQICTYENYLPQGAPTSPVISNMICRRLDKDFERLCQKNKIKYTRYADDLTFSWEGNNGDSVLLDKGHATPTIGTTINEIIVKNGFEINFKKVHFQTKSDRQMVTGIKVNDSLNLKRTFPRNIRAMLHAWQKYGYENAQQEYRSKYRSKHRFAKEHDPSFSHVIKGKLNYMRMVCGPDHSTYKKLLAQYNKLSDNISTETLSSKIQSSLWVIINEESCEQGTAFVLEGFGIVTCAHVLEGGTEIYAFKAEAPGNRIPVIKRAVDINADIALVGMAIPEDTIKLKADFSWQAAIGKKITVAGYPSYLGPSDQVFIDKGEIIQVKALPRTPTTWCIVNAKVVAGNSGGPVLNTSNRVVGVVVTGSQSHVETDQERQIKHGFVPIEYLKKLLT